MIRSFSGDYAFLSNFCSCRIRYNGLVYLSVENAYQAQKTEGIGRELFLHCRPARAKILGNMVRMRKGFEEEKLGIMHDLVLEKFTSHKKLQKLLLATGDEGL